MAHTHTHTHTHTQIGGGFIYIEMRIQRSYCNLACCPPGDTVSLQLLSRVTFHYYLVILILGYFLLLIFFLVFILSFQRLVGMGIDVNLSGKGKIKVKVRSLTNISSVHT